MCGLCVKHEGHGLKWKKQSAITYGKDWENEDRKMFIISLGNWTELESRPQSQAVHTSEYRPLNQPITAQLVPESYNKRLKTWKWNYGWRRSQHFASNVGHKNLKKSLK